MSKAQRVLLVDVGSASVGVCIAERTKDAGIVISRTIRTPLQNASGENTAAIAALALDAFKKSLTELDDASPAPKMAHVFLAAPWYNALIKSISFHSEKFLRINAATVEKAMNDYRSSHEAGLPTGATQVESAISQAYVNGYATNLKKLVHGNSLKIDFYESEADTLFVKSIEEALRETFAGIEVTMHTFAFAAFAVLRGLRDEQNFILIDVGGEITDLAVVNRDSMRFIGSFPIGSLTVLRSIAGKGSMADAASRLSLFAKDELSPEENSSFKMLFERATANWNEEYRKLLASASLEAPVPNTTFVTADKEQLLWFERVLKDAKTGFPARPTLISPSFFQTAVMLGEQAAYDAFLSIEALYTFVSS